MSGLEVAARSAVEADVPLLAQLVEQAIAAAGPQRGADLWRLEHAPSPPIEDALVERLNRADLGVLAGCLDGVPVGVALLNLRTLSDGRRMAGITLVFVEPGAREIGVGESLIDACLAWARGTGCIGLDGLALPGDRQTKNLYERAGMTAWEITVHRELTV